MKDFSNPSGKFGYGFETRKPDEFDKSFRMVRNFIVITAFLTVVTVFSAAFYFTANKNKIIARAKDLKHRALVEMHDDVQTIKTGR